MTILAVSISHRVWCERIIQGYLKTDMEIWDLTCNASRYPVLVPIGLMVGLDPQGQVAEVTFLQINDQLVISKVDHCVD